MTVRRDARMLCSVQEGQSTIVIAFAMVALIGILGLAIDVGSVFQQRQRVQNAAFSAAQAGAYETYGIGSNPPPAASPTLTDSQKDARVVNAMSGTLSQAGYQLSNQVGSTLPTPVSSACAKGASTSSASLQAEYINAQDTPIATPGGGPLLVGSGHYDANAHGVKIMNLGVCVPAYFAAVVGMKRFSVASAAQAGLLPPGPTSTPVPSSTYSAPAPGSTATSTATPGPSTQPVGIAPFVILGLPDPNGTTVSSPTTADSWSPAAPYMLFAKGSAYALTVSALASGDPVRLVGNANNWASAQYQNGYDAAKATPTGYSTHDASMEGCLSATLLSGYVGEDISAFSAGGVGAACAAFPSVGSTVTIPITQQACKQSGGCGNGGYSYIIQAFANVLITKSNNNDDLEGVIVGTPYDYYHIVDPPLPTATPLPGPLVSGG